MDLLYFGKHTSLSARSVCRFISGPSQPRAGLAHKTCASWGGSAFVEANAPVGTVSAAQTTAGKKAGAEIVSKTIELLESGKNKRQYQSRNKKEK